MTDITKTSTRRVSSARQSADCAASILPNTKDSIGSAETGVDGRTGRVGPPARTSVGWVEELGKGELTEVGEEVGELGGVQIVFSSEQITRHVVCS
ncbi:hypothetical protein FHS27_003280 [Rhodopirellula rubra]|uniref:Uncharacterized protein n=1 Tax=Aporhodopirellula rubra TaxID=980271 RepID=A0A7W5H6H1_9BACT|nr:hypothetical protein [Aporhodopirellula rubra]MBB3207459.1 hypothetical protein [Aporhodopirellula rubra]